MNATAPEPPQMERERPAVCAKLALSSEKLAKECDSVVKAGILGVNKRMKALNKMDVQPDEEAKTVIAQGRSICKKIGDEECSKIVSEARSKLVALQKEADETAAKKAAILGVTGASGASGAAGVAATVNPITAPVSPVAAPMAAADAAKAKLAAVESDF